MDTNVRTGQTKGARDLSLTSLALLSAHKEHVCLLMEIVGNEDRAKTAEHECETIVKHAMLEAEGEAAERLDSALKELNGLLKGLLVSGALQDIHMLLCIVDREQNLHVSHAGRAEAYVVRKGIASQITEYDGKPTPAFVHISSGALEPGDSVVLSTQRLLRSFTPAQLSRITVQDGTIDHLERALEADGEHAALAVIRLPADKITEVQEEAPRSRSASRPRSSARSAVGMAMWMDRVRNAMPSAETLRNVLPSSASLRKGKQSGTQRLTWLRTGLAPMVGSIREKLKVFGGDLRHPQRKKRAHFLLVAGALSALLVLWILVHLFTSTQRSKTKAELEKLMDQVNSEIQTAENRKLIGDSDNANQILQRAEEHAKEIMDNESGLFRVQALDLLDKIRAKKEQLDNIVRLTPRVIANLASQSTDVIAQGLIGMGDGEFIAYDPRDIYRVLLNSVEEPHRLSDDTSLIKDGTSFPRFQTLAFLMNNNTVMEWNNNIAISMKTDDPRGWVNGRAITGYLRFLYVLSPENKQIYKYERLSNRYGAPVNYNVNGDLTGGVDIAIDGSVYVLKEDGTVLKLFRGEKQPFTIRNAPSDLLKDTTKIFKVADRNFYVLDPAHKRVIVFSDGGASGESAYLKQYVLEGEQVGELKDLYVDADESRLYVMDEKRVFGVDLTAK